MEKIRARVQQKKNIYIHNDLSNAALHFKKSIETRLEQDNRAGITFDYMACAVMLAFTFEAKLNFLGHKLFGSEWNEKDTFDNKVDRVFEKLGVSRDQSKRPFSSIERLRAFRNTIAHGKPVEVEHDETVVAAQEELDRRIDLSGEWEKACRHDAVFEAYDDLDRLWKELLQKSKLEIFDTMTRGEGGITFIEKVQDV